MHQGVLESVQSPLNHPLYLTIFSLCLNLSGCISLSYTRFSPFSIDCNVVVTYSLQTSPRWTHERVVIFTIEHCWLLTQLPHPDRIAYHEYTCLHPADTPHTEIHNSPQLITNSVRPLHTQLSLIEFWRVPMLHQFLALHSPQMVEHSRINTSYRGVVCMGSGFRSWCQCSILPALWVRECHEGSSGAFRLGVSGCISYACAFANLKFGYPYRVLLKGVANIRQ